MMLAEQVAEFYPDLKDERFESAFAIYHQRYSTNTFPQWWLAQPFRMLAHNGEINTLKGNVNWMKSTRSGWRARISGRWPRTSNRSSRAASDSAALDAVFEVLVRAGATRRWPRPCWCPRHGRSRRQELPQAWQDMYSYCNSVMEPWDGPAALAMTDGRWVCAGLDRNGLRPMRYVVTGDGLMIAGSETGHGAGGRGDGRRERRAGPRPDDRRRHGRAAAVPRHRDQGRWPPARPFGDWVGKITDLDEAGRG
jgi:glutamate synthase (NADPH/NADH) large chain